MKKKNTLALMDGSLFIWAQEISNVEFLNAHTGLKTNRKHSCFANFFETEAFFGILEVHETL